MTTMIFVRHGQSLGNLNGEFLGHTDLDLSERGYMQAEKTAEKTICTIFSKYPDMFFLFIFSLHKYSTAMLSQ